MIHINPNNENSIKILSIKINLDCVKRALSETLIKINKIQIVSILEKYIAGKV